MDAKSELCHMCICAFFFVFFHSVFKELRPLIKELTDLLGRVMGLLTTLPQEALSNHGVEFHVYKGPVPGQRGFSEQRFGAWEQGKIQVTRVYKRKEGERQQRSRVNPSVVG